MAITDSLPPTEYANIIQYSLSAKTLGERIERIDDVITEMYSQIGQFALDSNISEYKFDNGKSVVHTVYRTPEQVEGIIRMLELLRNRLSRKLNGYKVKARTSIPKW